MLNVALVGLALCCLNSTLAPTRGYWLRRFGYTEGFVGPISLSCVLSRCQL